MDNIDMSAEAIAFRLKKVSQLRKLCVALKIGGAEKQPLEKNVSLHSNYSKIEQSK